MVNLKPPKNYREVSPRCCVTCIHYVEKTEDDGHNIPSYWNECERDGTGTLSEEDYFRVCDYYKSK